MSLPVTLSPRPLRRRFVTAALAAALLTFTAASASPQDYPQVSPDNRPPAGWFMAGSNPQDYETGIDRYAINNGLPSAFLRFHASQTRGFGTLMQSVSPTAYLGKRIRLTAWVKSQDVANWSGLWMRVDKQQVSVAFDNMQNRPIKGTESWTMHSVVLDVPSDATLVSFGILLAGAGQVWMNDTTLEVVGQDIPVTSIQPSTTPKLPTNLKFTD